MTVKICASIPASTQQDLKRMMKKAEQDKADLIEVRMDYIKGEYTLREVRNLSELPLIATNRPLREGGLFKGSEEERIHLLTLAAESDFDFIDVELSTADSREIVQKMRDIGSEVIISSHLFDETPSMARLNLIFEQELSTHADVCKIITSAKTFEDNLTSLRFVDQASKKADVVCFCMGELGTISRLLSPIFGSHIVYAAVDEGKKSAPGQLTVTEMRRFYEILGV